MTQQSSLKTFLCRTGDLDKTGAKTIAVEGESTTVLLVQAGEEIRAYTSRCPHMGVPLETFPDHVMDKNREFIICSTHGAHFEPETGKCVRGPCRGDFLDPHQIQVEQDEIYLIRS